MKLNDAIVAMQDETTALEVLAQCQPYFDKVDEISGRLASGQMETLVECRKLLSESTSIYMALNPLLSLADTEKSNREVQYYCNRKIEIERAGDKFVATSTSTEASAHVSTYRRVRNILDGYVNAIKTSISTCQSILKSMTDESKMTAIYEGQS